MLLSLSGNHQLSWGDEQSHLAVGTLHRYYQKHTPFPAEELTGEAGDQPFSEDEQAELTAEQEVDQLLLRVSCEYSRNKKRAAEKRTS